MRKITSLPGMLGTLAWLGVSSVASAQGNLLQNPGFDDGLTAWTPFGDATVQVISDPSDPNVLQIQNTTGDQSGVGQNIDFDPPTTQAFRFSYRVKPTQIDAGALVTMDVGVYYEDGTSAWVMGPLRTTTDDLGEWHPKSMTFSPMKPVSQIRALLINYDAPSAALYDDVFVESVPTTEYAFSSDYVEMTVNSAAQVSSIEHLGDQQLQAPVPLCKLLLAGGAELAASAMDPVPGEADTYRVQFDGVNAELKMTITTSSTHFAFRVVSLDNAPPDIDALVFLHVDPIHVPQASADKDWAMQAGDDTLFMNVLPLTVTTWCDRGAYQSCLGYARTGIDDLHAALVAAPKRLMDDATEQIVLQYGLPNVVMGDGRWLRKSTFLRNSYLFASINENNVDLLLNYAVRGRLPQFLAISPLVFGHHNVPRAFDGNLDSFVGALERFRSAGIDVGIHSHFGMIHPDDPSFHPTSVSLSGFRIGALTQDLAVDGTDVQIEQGFADDIFFQHYTEKLEGGKPCLRVGDELIVFGASTQTAVTGAERGQFGSVPSSHATGTDVFIMPNEGGGRFYVDTQNEALVDELSSSFAQVVQRTHSTFVYWDGHPVAPLPGVDWKRMKVLGHRDAVMAWFEKMPNLPFYQFGEGSPSFGWFYERRVASWDGVVFKNKEFVRNFKAPAMAGNNTFDQRFHEMGWWKMHGAQFGDGIFDFDAVTEDDVHYAMVKVLALDRSIGIQLGRLYDKHQRLDDMFDIVGTYSTLIEADMQDNIVPASVKQALRPVDVEAELRQDGTSWQLMEKKVAQKYAILDAAGTDSLLVTNPFRAQPLHVEIRPRFDYLPWGDAQHSLVTDFQSSSGFSISASGSTITCALQDQGQLSITKTGDEDAQCLILIPGDVDMTFKRGLGFSMEGDGQNETVFVRVYDSGWGVRDFRTVVDFTGIRDLVLADATTDIKDPVHGELVSTSGEALRRSWDFDYASPNSFHIRVVVKNPGTYNLGFGSLKALQEKPDSAVANPRIEVNGRTIEFPVTLSSNDTDPHILEYDGTAGVYRLFTSNHALLDTIELPSDIVMDPGESQVVVGADVSDPAMSGRLDVRVTVFDSEPTFDYSDQCPEDPDKIAPGVCGCGVSDVDSNANGTPDCVDTGGAGADPGGGDDGGCSCSLPRSRAGEKAWLLSLGGALLAGPVHAELRRQGQGLR